MHYAFRLIAPLVAAAALAGAAHSQTQNVRMIGRTDMLPGGGFEIQWPSSGFEATFEGTTFKATMYDWGSNWLNVEVDGVVKPLALDEETQTYTLFTGPAGKHTIRVTRRTGAQVGPTRIESFESDGTIQPTAAPDRRILVIGDSLASGFGVEGVNEKCTYTHATQNADLAYPALLGRSLAADVHVVAIDGAGLIKNYSGDGPTMSTVAWQTLPDSDRAWAALAWQPQVVVLSLGSTDFAHADPGAAFDDAYFFALRRLREAYPEARIVAAIGSQLWGKRYEAAKTSISDAVTAVQKLGDEKVSFVEFKPTRGVGRYGCEFHPGKVAQAQMAAALQAEIAPKLGWGAVD